MFLEATPGLALLEETYQAERWSDREKRHCTNKKLVGTVTACPQAKRTPLVHYTNYTPSLRQRFRRDFEPHYEDRRLRGVGGGGLLLVVVWGGDQDVLIIPNGILCLTF